MTVLKSTGIVIIVAVKIFFFPSCVVSLKLHLQTDESLFFGGFLL